MIDHAFHRAARQRLIECLQGGSVVLAAYDALQRSHDMAYPTDQEANFWYLTGITEPGWRLVIDGGRGKSWLLAPQLSDSQQLFDGAVSSEVAQQISGVDAVLPMRDMDELVRSIAAKHSIVYALGDDPHASYYSFTVNPAQGELWRYLQRVFAGVHDCRRELTQLRAIKQSEEITAIERAVTLTNAAFTAIKPMVAEARHEYEIEAEFSYYFRRHGAAEHAYDPIVAGGKNACTLHYTANTARLAKRSLLLIDIGARVDGYAADITRTYATSEPTKRQQAVHAAVVHAQQAIIQVIKPGLPIAKYQDHVDHVMGTALAQLGLVTGSDDPRYRQYFPHAISHGLGIDVHDSLGGPRFLEPGMVLTVEPGIYIPEEGIGVRIEDDILITATGNRILGGGLSTDW